MSDGSGATGTVCRGCGAEPRADARFCDGCGARLSSEVSRAEYKQVTVLFADVVGSMDIAATLGAERLHAIMTELFDRSSAVVKRFGGTVDKFTGDGVMAVFGAPIALEDHAIRACLASLELQNEAGRLAAEVLLSDDTTLLLRVGLNSGEVIAGEIGSGSSSYTSVGVQVGLAQRMESVAPPGGVMLSESTARLVAGGAVTGDPELVRIKGAKEPVEARRLLAVAARTVRPARQLSTLIGRQWELSTVAGMLHQSVDGKGRVVGLVGPPGIGKSRMVRELVSIATGRGVEVHLAACESHTSDLPFHVVARLLRSIFGVDGTDHEVARSNIRRRMPDADPEDLVLLDDLLAIRDAGTQLPILDADARRRRLAVLLKAAAAARTSPAVYVVEDAHWIDESSEAMLAGLAEVVPQTSSLLLLTYRPEYDGALNRLPGSHRIALAPLTDSESSTLAAELLGGHPSVMALVASVAGRAAGNPFFAEEIIRDLAERGVIYGEPGAYSCVLDTADLRVPASLQAAIAARIDRLGRTAKVTLNAAAVIGSQFDSDLLARLVDNSELAELVTAELIDQVTFMHNARYTFRHPMIRAVAYESQLKSDRARVHLQLATVIGDREPDRADANAALVAQHLEAAGDLRAAYRWHMRAGTWAQHRDANSARTSWQRAREAADGLDADDADVPAMRIAPRVALSVSTFKVSGSLDDAGFDELRALCTSAGDSLSLAAGMAGMLTGLIFHSRYRDASLIATECITLLDSMADQPHTVSLYAAAGNAKVQAGEVVEGLRVAQRAIELADGDPLRDNSIVGSPLAVAYGLSGFSRVALGMPGWRDDLDRAASMAKSVDLTSHVAGTLYKYVIAMDFGAMAPDSTARAETAGALEAAERCGDDFSLDSARLARGLVLVKSAAAQRSSGLALLNQYRDACIRHGYATDAVRWVDIENAKERARVGDLDGAVTTARTAVDFLYRSGDMTSRGSAVTVLVELLIRRHAAPDLAEAAAVVDRLAAVPTDPGFVLHELPLLRLRALLAQAYGDDAAYRQYRDRYRKMADELGFEGHMALGAAMA